MCRRLYVATSDLILLIYEFTRLNGYDIVYPIIIGKLESNGHDKKDLEFLEQFFARNMIIIW